MICVLIYSPSFAWQPGSSPAQVVVAAVQRFRRPIAFRHTLPRLFPVSPQAPRRDHQAAPGGTAVLCFGFAALRVLVPPLRGHPPRKRAWALGSSHPSRPSRLSAPSRSGERNGGFNRMYQNRISLMGFTSKDAEARTTKNQTAYRRIEQGRIDRLLRDAAAFQQAGEIRKYVEAISS